MLYCPSNLAPTVQASLCIPLILSWVKFKHQHMLLPNSDSLSSSSWPARVLVHCAVGVSRSASLVLAYLMIHHHYTLLEAIHKVKERRWIFPNRGFLKQLRALDMTLRKTSWVILCTSETNWFSNLQNLKHLFSSRQMKDSASALLTLISLF